ncbi:MAG: baseplate J/gp47 family protein [Alphaproteobacteria bacterium]|nr:baseplate J/gp47 family protein [Alphaproteobacteria bacterium]
MPIATESGFARLTFDELLAQRQAAYRRLFGDTPADGVLARLAEVDAEMQHALHGHIDHEIRQFLPWLATGERLKAWGRVLVGDMKGAAAAAGTIRLTGLDGRPLADGARLTRSDGVEYRVAAGGTIAAGILDVAIEAVVAGAAGNAAAGTTATLVNPVDGIDGTATILAPGLTGGAEAETEDSYRGRVLLRLREPPMAGNDTDYRTWALQVAGISRAWVRRGPAGTGEVVILVMTDGLTADGIPVGAGAPNYSGDLARVIAHIEAVAPAPGVRYAKAPVPKPINYVIHGLDPDTPAIRAAIEASIDDVHLRRSEPGKAWRWSWGSEAVSAAAGEDGFDGIEPAVSTVCDPDEIAVKGTVTYVP